MIDLYQSARELHFYALNGKSFNSFQSEINFSVNRKLDIRTAYRFLDVKTKYKSGLIEKPLLSKHRLFLQENQKSSVENRFNHPMDRSTNFFGDNDSLFQLLEEVRATCFKRTTNKNI